MLLTGTIYTQICIVIFQILSLLGCSSPIISNTFNSSDLTQCFYL